MTVFVAFGLVFTGSLLNAFRKASGAVLSRPRASSRANMTRNAPSADASLSAVSGGLNQLPSSGTYSKQNVPNTDHR
mgnify:CR=1 FL=1